MIFGRGVMTNRTLPVSVATELEMFAVFHGSSVQLETVPKKDFREIHVKTNRKPLSRFCL